jgi:hypothetical protein
VNDNRPGANQRAMAKTKKAPHRGLYLDWLEVKTPHVGAFPRDDSFIVVVATCLLGVVPEIGIEPTTSSLRMTRSTN